MSDKFCGTGSVHKPLLSCIANCVQKKKTYNGIDPTYLAYLYAGDTISSLRNALAAHGSKVSTVIIPLLTPIAARYRVSVLCYLTILASPLKEA